MSSDTISIQATLKKAGGRPARDPGDKPIFELVLRSEVNPQTVAIMAKLGKDFMVSLVPVPDAQASLPWDDSAVRTTVVDGDNFVVDTAMDQEIIVDDEDEHTNGVVVPGAGRRRRGTRASVLEE